MDSTIILLLVVAAGIATEPRDGVRGTVPQMDANAPATVARTAAPPQPEGASSALDPRGANEAVPMAPRPAVAAKPEVAPETQSEAAAVTEPEMTPQPEPAAAAATPSETAPEARLRLLEAREPAAGSAAPGIGGAPDIRQWMTSLAPLAIVIALIGGGAWGLRQWAGRGRSGRHSLIRVLNRTFLSSKQSVALIRVGRTLMLVGITAEHIDALATIQDPQEVDRLIADAEPARLANRRFEDLLGGESRVYPAAGLEAHVGEADLGSVRQTRRSLQELCTRMKSLTQQARSA